MVVLRNMLRDEGIKMRWHAAKTLVGLRIDPGKLGLRIQVARGAAGQIPNPSEDADHRLFRFLQQQSDERLAQVAEAMRPPMADELGPAWPGGGHAEHLNSRGKR